MIHKFTLPNGVRILIEPNDTVHSAAVGLWCRTGSVHELDDEAGITHFIEHMLFKGTIRRTAKDIAEAIEGRGGVLNAFTDKESTCYYCRVLADDVENGMDVLTDMMLHCQLAQEEIERERGVITEEIKRSEDEPGDHVHELHSEGRWGDHALGKPIIGTRESVASFAQPNFRRYMDRRYRGENIVLAIAGRVDLQKVLDFVTPVLEQFPAGAENPEFTAPLSNVGKRQVAKDVEQVHFCIGSDSISVYDDRIYTAAVLDAVLGSGMSSRLFQEVRERRGLAYSIGSYNLSYSAAGLFTVYGGTGADTWEQVQEVVGSELKKIQSSPISEDELRRTKQLLTGHMVLGLEGMNARMMRMARNELIHGRDIPLEETLSKLNAVSAADIQDLAGEMFDESRISTTAIGPF